MPRIAGVDVPEEKRIEIALTYIYGVGRTTARKILDLANIDYNIRAKNLTEEQIARIRETLDNVGVPVEGELRRIIFQNIKRLKDVASYRGIRHRKKLPVRGQRTRHNARTKRGKRQTVGGLKRIVQKT